MSSPDAIVIGAGAVGGWAAKQLTEAGLSVTLLDAGPALGPESLAPPDEAKRLSWRGVDDAPRQPIQAKNPSFGPHNRHLFVDDVDHPYTTPEGKPFHWIRGRQVGGRSLTWGGVCLRMTDYDFKAPERDGVGQPWPIAYADLRDAFDEVERFLGVRGSNEGLAAMPDGALGPAAPMTPGERHLREVVQQRWPERRVIHARGIDLSIRSHDGWPTYAIQGSTLAAAARTGRLTVVPNAVVHRIHTDPATGAAARVELVDATTGSVSELRARVFVLCASTIETARILLNSASPQHPAGLANGSGVVGRYLMDHPLVRVLGTATGYAAAEADRWEIGGPNAIYVPAFRNTDGPSSTFVRGYGTLGIAQRRGLPRPDPTSVDASYLLAALGEGLPSADNRVTIDPTTKDRHGIPSVRIEYAWTDNDRALAADALAWLREASQAAGFHIDVAFTEPTIPGTMIHEVGTARMGADPRSSVVSPINQCWEVKNLFITDGACWPTSGSKNPTLTMMAITVRACAHIVSALRRLEL